MKIKIKKIDKNTISTKYLVQKIRNSDKAILVDAESKSELIEKLKILFKTKKIELIDVDRVVLSDH